MLRKQSVQHVDECRNPEGTPHDDPVDLLQIEETGDTTHGHRAHGHIRHIHDGLGGE